MTKFLRSNDVRNVRDEVHDDDHDDRGVHRGDLSAFQLVDLS